jgi:ribokinase
VFFALEGDHTLGRNESRPARLLDVRDYCKLHIIAHYVAALLGATRSGLPFRVTPIGMVGDDAVGERLYQEMQAVGMDTRFVEKRRDLPTLYGICFQYPDGSGGNITATNSAAHALTAADVDKAEPLFAAHVGQAIALAAPEVTLPVRSHLLKLAGRYGALRVAALTSVEMRQAQEMGLLQDVDLLAMNEDEAAALVGRHGDADAPQPFLDDCVRVLTSIQPHMRIVVTWGKMGAYAWEAGRWNHCPAPPVRVVNTAGAGDALLGGIMSCLAAGVPLLRPPDMPETSADGLVASALDFAVLLASYTVTSPHTIHPEADLPALQSFAQSLDLRFAGRLRPVVGL